MDAITDQKPRISLGLAAGREAHDLRGALESLRDELDAVILEQLGVLIGALSRTQVSQLEAKEGLELRLWVFPKLIRGEVRDRPHGGWSLAAVEHLADRWGVSRQQDGRFLLWFELGRARTVPRATAPRVATVQAA